MKTKTVHRNDPCPCGSGRKYKNCCEGKRPWYRQAKWTGLLGAIIILGSVLLAWATATGTDTTAPGQAPPGKVWSPEHGHYH
jgi:hypothetical protein